MTARDVLDVLLRLDGAGVEWWVDGGWGVDALLGEETRPHADLDLAVRAEHVELLERTLRDYRRVATEAGSFVLRDGEGREVDVHPIELDDRGDGWQEQAGGSRARWPREALAWRGSIAGREVRCTSPQFQIEAHLYAGHDDVDWQDVEVLCRRFGLRLPEGLRPGFVHPKRSREAPPAVP